MGTNQVWADVELLRRSYTRTLEPVCERFGLTRMELDVLLFLANHPEQDTAAEMIRVRGVSKSHVSASVKNLARLGYLTGMTRPGDHKSIHLRLLPASGFAVEAGQRAQQAFSDVLAEELSPEEHETILRALERLRVRLSAEE